MNCDCNVPVAIRITKSGTNIGRSYFCCAAGKCSLYGMMTENNALPTHFDPSLYRNKGDLNADKGPKKSSQISVKMALYKIDNFPLPFRIWFTLSHPYNLPLINLYKSLPPDMCKYDESKKLWIFDLEIFETMISHLTSSAFSSFVEVTELPKFLSNGLRKYCHTIRSSSSSLPSAESGDEIKLNICPGLLSKLKSFQVETVKFVLRHGGRAMLGDEMGCGKTAQAIACMQQYVDHWPVLILMPPSLLAQWKGELLKFCSELLSERDICLVSKASDAVDGKVCLVPYTRLQNLVKAGKIRKEQFGVVICDESHNLKSKDSLRTTLVLLTASSRSFYAPLF